MFSHGEEHHKPSPVLMKIRCVLTNEKPIVQEVELIEANLTYVHVKLVMKGNNCLYKTLGSRKLTDLRQQGCRGKCSSSSSRSVANNLRLFITLEDSTEQNMNTVALHLQLLVKRLRLESWRIEHEPDDMCRKKHVHPALLSKWKRLRREAATGTSSAHEAARRWGTTTICPQYSSSNPPAVPHYKLQSCNELLSADATGSTFREWASLKWNRIPHRF
ncbi:hypothetical protein TNCV_4376041 [Trichonephila clavipes]|nr:hypothetical protein TNCV_4376041 [Trichonephila clavipes]